jgi:hypothetical protein
MWPHVPHSRSPPKKEGSASSPNVRAIDLAGATRYPETANGGREQGSRLTYLPLASQSSTPCGPDWASGAPVGEGGALSPQ